MPCSHASLCIGCRKYRCANDEIHHCVGCHDNLSICETCSRLDTYTCNYKCKLCFKETKNNSERCFTCKRARRITVKDRKTGHITCRSCYFKERFQLTPKKKKAKKIKEHQIRLVAYYIWKETGCSDEKQNWEAAIKRLSV